MLGLLPPPDLGGSVMISASHRPTLQERGSEWISRRPQGALLRGKAQHGDLMAPVQGMGFWSHCCGQESRANIQCSVGKGPLLTALPTLLIAKTWSSTSLSRDFSSDRDEIGRENGVSKGPEVGLHGHEKRERTRHCGQGGSSIFASISS